MFTSHELPNCVYGQTEPVLIRPKSPTPRKTLYLSNLDDQKFLRFTTKFLYVFEKSIESEMLKHALSRVLVEYYPLAGRLKPCVENDDGKLEIDCNEEGAVFVEAKMDMKVEEFLESYADKPNRSLRKLLYRVEAPAFFDTPPLVVQVTNLGCGGMILGIAFNHCFCDGIGASQFLHAWGRMCHSTDALITQMPYHDRRVLQPRIPPQVTFPHPEFAKIPPKDSDIQTTPNLFKYLQSQPLTVTSITFSRAQILRLKTQCAPSLKCSTFEVVASHTWRCWVKSLGLPPSTNVKLLFSVNVRNKLSPHIPRGYYGNAFVMACAKAEVKELGGPNLHDGVKLVQHAKSRITNEYVRSMIDLLEDKSVSTDLSTTMIISQWSRLGLEELDFGQGKPLHMGPLYSDVYCIFLPVYGERDSVKVLVSMPDGVVDKFESYMKESHIGVVENRDVKIHTSKTGNFKVVSI